MRARTSRSKVEMFQVSNTARHMVSLCSTWCVKWLGCLGMSITGRLINFMPGRRNDSRVSAALVYVCVHCQVTVSAT